MSNEAENKTGNNLKKIYLDYNATTPLDNEVIKAIHESMVNHWGNPSSSHEEGIEAKKAIEKARQEVADMISAISKDIIFLSGGTEANNMVIYSSILHYRKWCLSQTDVILSKSKPHIITTKVEHDAIKLPLLQRYSVEADVTFLNSENLPDAVMDSIRPTTCLITVMLANNETGIMFSVAHIARLLIDINKRREAEGLFRVLLHTDASQAIGKVPVDVLDLNVDYLTITGHKFYGPRIGALYIRDLGVKTPLYPVFYGGKQERGYRSGTENTPMIVGLGKASALVSENIHIYNSHMKKMRSYLERQLKKIFKKYVKINCVDPCSSNADECSVPPNGPKQQHFIFPRLPNTSSISFYYSQVTGESVLKNCKVLQAGVGAACHSTDCSKSVLESSGVCSFHAKRTIRLSLGRTTTFEEIDWIIEDLRQSVDTVISCNEEVDDI